MGSYDSRNIEPYSVLRVTIEGDPPFRPYLVALFHEPSANMIVAAGTSERVGFYRDSDMSDGCVFYEDNETCIPGPTVILPHDNYPLQYANLTDHDVCGTMPDDFHDRLIAAIRCSVRLTHGRRQSLLNHLL